MLDEPSQRPRAVVLAGHRAKEPDWAAFGRIIWSASIEKAWTGAEQHGFDNLTLADIDADMGGYWRKTADWTLLFRQSASRNRYKLQTIQFLVRL